MVDVRNMVVSVVEFESNFLSSPHAKLDGYLISHDVCECVVIFAHTFSIVLYIFNMLYLKIDTTNGIRRQIHRFNNQCLVAWLTFATTDASTNALVRDTV